MLVEETDVKHGGIDRMVHRDACERHCGEDAREAFDTCTVIPWYRVPDFQMVSLRLILQHIISPGRPKPIPLRKRSTIELNEVYIRGELTHSILWLATPGKLQQSVAERSLAPVVQLAAAHAAANKSQLARHHLYISPHNMGAEAVGEMLQEETRLASAVEGAELTITRQPEEWQHASFFLLYLNEHTFDSGPEKERLYEELGRALEAGMKMLLIHEQREEHGAVPFDHFVGRYSTVTPHRLRHLGIYHELAVPLYSGAHGRVSLRMALRRPGLTDPPPEALRWTKRWAFATHLIQSSAMATTAQFDRAASAVKNEMPAVRKAAQRVTEAVLKGAGSLAAHATTHLGRISVAPMLGADRLRTLPKQPFISYAVSPAWVGRAPFVSYAHEKAPASALSEAVSAAKTNARRLTMDAQRHLARIASSGIGADQIRTLPKTPFISYAASPAWVGRAPFVSYAQKLPGAGLAEALAAARNNARRRLSTAATAMSSVAAEALPAAREATRRISTHSALGSANSLATHAKRRFTRHAVGQDELLPPQGQQNPT